MDKYQCLKLLSYQVFFTKLSKNNTWASCYFFLRTKIIFPIKCIVFFSKNKNNIGGHHVPPMMGGIRHYPSFIHHPQHPSPAHPTTHPPQVGAKFWSKTLNYYTVITILMGFTTVFMLATNQTIIL